MFFKNLRLKKKFSRKFFKNTKNRLIPLFDIGISRLTVFRKGMDTAVLLGIVKTAGQCMSVDYRDSVLATPCYI